jgi:hypothetical protein
MVPGSGHTGGSQSAKRRTVEAQLEGGILAGVVSAIPTATLLSLGGSLTGWGPWAPFYSIVSVLVPGGIEQARDFYAAGNEVPLYNAPFMGGLGLCLLLGAVSGAVFAFGIRNRVITGAVRYLLGALHGIFMMCVFYLGAQQAVGAVLGMNSDAMSLSVTSGWPMLVAAHAVHGLVVAWVTKTRLGTGASGLGATADSPTR